MHWDGIKLLHYQYSANTTKPKVCRGVREGVGHALGWNENSNTTKNTLVREMRSGAEGGLAMHRHGIMNYSNKHQNLAPEFRVCRGGREGHGGAEWG